MLADLHQIATTSDLQADWQRLWQAFAETVTRALQAGTDQPVAVSWAKSGSALIGHARRSGIGIAVPEEGPG